MLKSVYALAAAIFALTTTAYARVDVPLVEVEVSVYPDGTSGQPTVPPLEKRLVKGSAVYLGHGRFLTAAHVVVSGATLSRKPTIRRAWVIVAGKRFASRYQIAEHFDIQSNLYGKDRFLDLGVVDTQRHSFNSYKIHPVGLCVNPGIPGDRVEVKSVVGIKHAQITASKGPYAAIDMVAEPGDSGGGIFSVSGCLTGIVSQIEPDDIQTNRKTLFVPVDIIKAFLEILPST